MKRPVSSIPFHKRIGVRILFTLISVAVFSVLLTTVSHNLLSSAIMRSNVAERNLQIARQAAGQIELYLDDAFRSVHAVAQILTPIRNGWLQDTILENTIALLGKFRVAHVIALNGTILASSELDNRVVEYDPGLFEQIASEERRFVSDVRLTRDNLPIITIAEPVYRMDEPDARFVADLNLRTVWELVDDISFGRNVRAYLVTSDHTLIAHPDKTKVLTVFKTDYLPDAGTGWNESSFTGLNQERRALLVSTAPTDTLDWHLVIEQPLSDAFMPIYASLVTLGVVALLVLSAAIAASMFLSRSYSKPLGRVLEGTYHIRRGDLQYRLPIDTEDEIGRLARGFNRMVEDLQRRSIELEQSEEKYRLLTENINDIIFLADREGKIVHLNRQAASLMGVERSSLLDMSLFDVLSVDVHEKAKSIIDGEHPESLFEVELRTANETPVVLEIKLVVTEDPKYGTLYYGVARDITERKIAESRLESYQKQLRSLASQLSLAEARERQKIAAQIHDRIGQALALARIRLGSLAQSAVSEQGKETVRATMKLIDEIIQDTRSLIFSVSSPLLYEVGLGAALDQLVEQFQNTHELDFGFTNGDGTNGLDTDISVLLFDSVRELMANVVKHAGARHCRVRLETTETEVRIAVSDDGIGMNGHPDSSSMSDKGGFGLFSIRERLNHLGGAVTITANRGTGTTVVLTAPRSRN